MVNLIVYAIPFFFIMIGIEYVLSVVARRQLYRWNDSVNDLSLGIIDQVAGVLFSWLSLVVSYAWVYKHWRIVDWHVDAMSTAGVACVWVIAFLAKDFAYYWAHRMSHEMNIGWATHIAHHQSEEYNLSVALRQGVFQPFFFNFFYIPFAFVGLPPAIFFVCAQINTIYQFWIHTRAIGKLGPLEWVLNTPSHHRVHHGRDAKYIDRNHAGVFIIWDRMFGTFQEEEEEPHFGLVSQLASWNPLWAQTHYLIRLVKLTWAAPRWLDKVRVWYREPSWLPEGIAAPEVSSQERWDRGELQVYNPKVPAGLRWYVAYHFVPLLSLTTGMLLALGAENKAPFVLPGMEQVAGALGGASPFRLTYVIDTALILWALFALGGALERKRWMLFVEPVRLGLMTLVFGLVGGAPFGLPQLSGPAASGLFLMYGIISFAWLFWYRSEFTVPMGRLLGQPVELDDALPEAA